MAPILFAIAVLDTGKHGGNAIVFCRAASCRRSLALVLIVGLGRIILRPFFQLVADDALPSSSWRPACSS